MLAGIRTDPPVSDPSPIGAMPAATATPVPELDPPGRWGSGCHGLCGVPVVGVDAGAAVRELHRDGLAEQHHPGPGEAIDDGAVGVRHVVCEEAGARGGRQPRHVVQVLGHVGDAVQRAEVDARAELQVGGPRLREGAFAAHHRERPEARLQRLDAIQKVLRDGRGRQLAGPDRPSQLDDRAMVDGGGHLACSEGWRRGRCISTPAGASRPVSCNGFNRCFAMVPAYPCRPLIRLRSCSGKRTPVFAGMTSLPQPRPRR